MSVLVCPKLCHEKLCNFSHVDFDYFLFSSVFHRPSPVFIIQSHIAPLFFTSACVCVAKKCAARNNGKTLCAWTLFYIPFDLHELIKTIVQRNERTNCEVKRNQKKTEENKTPLRKVVVIKNRVAPKFHASANFKHTNKLLVTIHFHMKTKNKTNRKKLEMAKSNGKKNWFKRVTRS